VGLCSYLLIGHYFHKPSAAGAAKKAFVVNRIGDLGLIIAIVLIAIQFNTLDFNLVFSGIKNNFLTGDWLMTTLAALMFLAVIGKSAQFPLHVWLPDAMEGPTPVSALIHAATMVTAGIFLMIRASVIFQLAPLVLTVISVVGCVTALGAAMLAMVQYDLKKVLAYSTVSQLGYMALACGVGAYSAAFFHLLTHAFFKAVLFLGAGSVIYALHHEQDMRKMGGLYKKMPVTFVTFLVGALALSGFPGTAGFFSKDEILAQSFLSPNGHFLFWAVGLITAGLTAFYMFRALTMVFLRKNNSDLIDETKESPWQMGLPLIILAMGSIVTGYLNIPRSLGGSLWLEHFLAPTFQFVHEEIPFIQTIPDYGMEHFLLGLTTVVVLYLLFIGVRFYRTKLDIPKKVSNRFPGFTKILRHQYYLDTFYLKTIVQPRYS
jgi:NADH-quinone oxidoreductase subunit L